MRIFGAIAVIISVLLISESSPIGESEVEPVNLSHLCITVVKEGVPDDLTPILLLHGLGATKEGWEGYYEVLAFLTGRKVCIADLRNHGDSPRSEDADVGVMAKDINKLLDTIGTEKIILLGHSLGGKLAVHVALTYPERVEKLIVEDMRPNGISPKVVQDVKVFLSLVKIGINAIPGNLTDQEAKEAFAKFLFTFLKERNITLTLEKEQIEKFPIRCSNGKCEWQVNLDIFESVIKDPESFLTHSEGVYEGPSLFIYGTKSPFKVGEDEANIRRLFPNVQLVPIEGASHGVHITHNKQFWDITVKFIEED